jgi:hypothetical protein
LEHLLTSNPCINNNPGVDKTIASNLRLLHLPNKPRQIQRKTSKKQSLNAISHL